MRWEVRVSDPRRERLWRALLVLALAGLPLAYFAGQQRQDGEAGVLRAERDRLERLTVDQARTLERLRQLFAVAESGEQLAHQASEQNRQAIKALEERIYTLQQDLAFYQGILAPDSRREGLRIGAFELHAGETPTHFRYRLVLGRVGAADAPLAGRLRLTLIGRQAGKDTEVDLAPLSRGLPDPKEAAIPFGFKHFQAIPDAGRYAELTLPAGFEPRQVKVRADVEGKGEAQERLFEWKEEG